MDKSLHIRKEIGLPGDGTKKNSYLSQTAVHDSSKSMEITHTHKELERLSAEEKKRATIHHGRLLLTVRILIFKL